MIQLNDEEHEYEFYFTDIDIVDSSSSLFFVRNNVSVYLDSINVHNVVRPNDTDESNFIMFAYKYITSTATSDISIKYFNFYNVSTHRNMFTVFRTKNVFLSNITGKGFFDNPLDIQQFYQNKNGMSRMFRGLYNDVIRLENIHVEYYRFFATAIVISATNVGNAMNNIDFVNIYPIFDAYYRFDTNYCDSYLTNITIFNEDDFNNLWIDEIIGSKNNFSDSSQNIFYFQQTTPVYGGPWTTTDNFKIKIEYLEVWNLNFIRNVIYLNQNQTVHIRSAWIYSITALIVNSDNLAGDINQRQMVALTGGYVEFIIEDCFIFNTSNFKALIHCWSDAEYCTIIIKNCAFWNNVDLENNTHNTILIDNENGANVTIVDSIFIGSNEENTVVDVHGTADIEFINCLFSEQTEQTIPPTFFPTAFPTAPPTQEAEHFSTTQPTIPDITLEITSGYASTGATATGTSMDISTTSDESSDDDDHTTTGEKSSSESTATTSSVGDAPDDDPFEEFLQNTVVLTVSIVCLIVVCIIGILICLCVYHKPAKDSMDHFVTEWKKRGTHRSRLKLFFGRDVNHVAPVDPGNPDFNSGHVPRQVTQLTQYGQEGRQKSIQLCGADENDAYGLGNNNNSRPSDFDLDLEPIDARGTSMSSQLALANELKMSEDAHAPRVHGTLRTHDNIERKNGANVNGDDGSSEGVDQESSDGNNENESTSGSVSDIEKMFDNSNQNISANVNIDIPASGTRLNQLNTTETIVSESDRSMYEMKHDTELRYRDSQSTNSIRTNASGIAGNYRGRKGQKMTKTKRRKKRKKKNGSNRANRTDTVESHTARSTDSTATVGRINILGTHDQY